MKGPVLKVAVLDDYQGAAFKMAGRDKSDCRRMTKDLSNSEPSDLFYNTTAKVYRLK